MAAVRKLDVEVLHTRLANQIVEKMADKVGTEFNACLDADGDFSEDVVFEYAFGQVMGDLPELLYDYYRELLWDHPIMKDGFRHVRDVARDTARDLEEWDRAQRSHGAMLAYHGLSTKDFM